MKCKNCGYEFSGNYCTNCGQKANTSRFDWKHIGKQVLDSFDLDRGFIYTLYNLIIRPGHLIRGYIEGKRIGVANPLKLLLIIGTITNVLSIEAGTFLAGSFPFEINLEDITGYFNYSAKYFSFFSYTGVPFFSFISWLLFLKLPYNFIEHLIANVYVLVGQFLLLILFIPFLYLTDNNFMNVYGVANAAYNVWAMGVFLNLKSIKSYIILTLAVIAPLMAVSFYNYLLYRLVNEEFWLFLDRFFG